MAIIYSYPTATPKASDLLIGTVTYDGTSGTPVDGNPTRTFNIGDIANLLGGYTLSSQAAGVNANIVLTSSLGAITAVNLLRGNGISISDNGSNGITLGNTGVLSIISTNSTFVSSTPVLSSTGNVTISSSLSATGSPSNLNYLRGDNTWSTPVTTITTQDSQFINLTPNSSSNGAVTITAQLSAAGSPSSSNFLRGDNVWAVPAGGGTITSINAGTGIAVDNSNPSDPIVSNTGVLSNIAGTGISISSATGNSTITNTAPDQTVVITGTGDTVVTGTYPSFNISSDSGVTQILAGTDISISPGGGTGIVTINSTSQGGVTSIVAGDNVTLSPISGLGDVTVSAPGLIPYVETSTASMQFVSEDVALGGGTSSDTVLSSQLAIKTYVDNAVVGGLIYQGGYDASTNTPVLDSRGTQIAITQGWTYTVTVDGTFYGEVVKVGDVLIAETNLSAGTGALTDWTTVQSNIDLATAGTTATAIRGLAGFDTDNFTVVNGFVNLKVGDIIPSNIVQSVVAGTAISIDVSDPENPIVTNTLPDQTVVITGSGGATVTGTYPNFNISTTDNEGVETIVAGTAISVDSTNPASPIINNLLPDQTVVLTEGDNVTIIGTYPNFTISSADSLVDSVNGQTGVVVLNTDNISEGSTNLYDKTVVITGSGGATVTGTYPNFNINTTDEEGVESVTATGIGINVNNTDPANPIISNTLPDQTVVITGSGGATITGTYPSFNIDTTDATGVETLVAGTAISIDSTDAANPIVTNTAPDQTVVITGSGDTTVTGTYPTFDISSDSGVTQIVAGNDISISPVDGTGVVTINSTSQGGVTSLIAGTNITLDPATGLGDVTITSADTIYTAGTGVDITNEVITNTEPDQVVSITGTGVAVVTGTYPDFNVNVAAGEQGVMAKDSFVSNGIETNYQLSVTPTSATYTEVFISGVYQEASTYTLSADTITLSTAPDSGDTIEIVTFNLGSAGGGGGSGAVDSIIAGTGISVSGPTGNVTVTNTAPDQTVALTGSGAATVTGTYPSFNVATPVVNTADFITNANDVYPSVNKVTDIISLTQAEYDALTPDESAIYIIVG